MKLEEQVLSIEQARHLQELGLDMYDAAVAWYPPYKYGDDGLPIYLYDAVDDDYYLAPYDERDKGIIPAYTIQEIWNTLQNNIHINGCIYNKTMKYDNGVFHMIYKNEMKKGDYKALLGYSCIGVLYEMLCWVIENGYLKTK